jgi:hypothetical protein
MARRVCQDATRRNLEREWMRSPVGAPPAPHRGRFQHPPVRVTDQLAPAPQKTGPATHHDQGFASVTLHLGDCVDVPESLADNSVDAVVRPALSAGEPPQVRRLYDHPHSVAELDGQDVGVR